MGVRHLDVAAVLDLSSRHPRPGPRALTLRIASEHMTLREVIARAVEVELRHAEARAEAALGAVLVAILGAGGTRVGGSLGCDLHAETERALEGFRDGTYRVLLDGQPVADLDERLSLGLRSRVTFVRVVPLVGG